MNLIFGKISVFFIWYNLANLNCNPLDARIFSQYLLKALNSLHLAKKFG